VSFICYTNACNFTHGVFSEILIIEDIVYDNAYSQPLELGGESSDRLVKSAQYSYVLLIGWSPASMRFTPQVSGWLPSLDSFRETYRHKRRHNRQTQGR
jgi:hypothetical protein